MPKATASLQGRDPPVIAHHLAAEAAIARADRPTAARLARCQTLITRALAVRSNSIAELTHRLDALRATLAHEEASDYALALIEAISRDVDHLAGGPRRVTA